MSAALKISSVNQILKDTIIYEKGQAQQSISLIVKGKVTVRSAGTITTVTSGAFLGISDLFVRTFQADYIAETNCVIYCFPATGNVKDILSIIQTNIDYGSLMVTSLSKYIRSLGQIAESLNAMTDELPDFLKEMYKKYQDVCNTHGAFCAKLPAIDNIKEINDGKPLDLNVEQISYYMACCGIKPDIQKAYYGSSPVVCIYHIRQQVALVQQLYQYCEIHSAYLASLGTLLIIGHSNLFASVSKLTLELTRMGAANKEALSCMDNLIDKINVLEELLCEKTGADFNIDRSFMEEAYYSALNSDTQEAAPIDIAIIDDLDMASRDDLDHSLDQILEFSGVDDELAGTFRNQIEEFMHLKNKLATDEDVRKLRRGIANSFYPIYHAVFLKDYRSKEKTPLPVDFFLKYGFVSEHLVSEDIMDALLSIREYEANDTPCKIYNMKEWLTAIYEGDKEPSKNEFDLDYAEHLREQRKTSSITAAEEEVLAKDQEKKLAYEVNNMFRCTHRILCSQISTFVPILHTDACVGNLSKAFLSGDKINAAIRRLMAIDFSVFYRELMYSNPEIGIQKEYTMQEVCPDIILSPVFGSSGQMWQELSGKRRNSPGRFILPIFLEGNMLDQVITRCCGRFRWELCRTMQGVSWNNVQIKSLTSEYSDYIGFYKKNRDLSDERKEKLRLQIQKCRNNTREIFALDYESWIKNESRSSQLLTKPVREIMATYCPFSKEIRAKQEGQPAFVDAFARFNRERAKKNREMDLRFRVLEKDGIEIPEELIATKEFYTL